MKRNQKQAQKEKHSQIKEKPVEVKKTKKETKSKSKDKVVEVVKEEPAVSAKKTTGRVRKSEERREKQLLEREAKKHEKEYLEEKYDINLRDSDDSSDEENLLRNGNVPKEWYDLYDHKGYGVKGQ